MDKNEIVDKLAELQEKLTDIESLYEDAGLLEKAEKLIGEAIDVLSEVENKKVV